MNLCRMNLYRMTKMKSFYILLAWLLAGTLFLFIVDKGDSEPPDGAAVILISQFLANGVCSLLTAIYISLFMNAERESGYLKNLGSCTDSRVVMYFSKLPVVMVFIALQYLIVIIVGFAVCGWSDTEISDFAVYLLLLYLFHVVFGMFLMMIMELSRHLLAGILVGIFVALGIILPLISQFFVYVLKWEGAAKLMEYFATNRLAWLGEKGVAVVQEDCSSLFANIIVLAVIYGYVGVLSFRKRDIY